MKFILTNIDSINGEYLDFAEQSFQSIKKCLEEPLGDIEGEVIFTFAVPHYFFDLSFKPESVMTGFKIAHKLLDQDLKVLVRYQNMY